MERVGLKVLHRGKEKIIEKISEEKDEIKSGK
ncbi:uncharacterized protein G2W53_031646 [Senna tora]|uniref:Uncharacterized protein n=1 Tax=Senna tora TaxID=362788 RepID=A0A834T9N4_9FABA|nr:uncharacterized protein G2W53_031646 [Senna tora]